MPHLDLLAVVSRPDLPSGNGPIGDNFGLRRLLASRPDWQATILELNARPTDARIEGATFVIEQEGALAVDLGDVDTVLYLPVCLEPEETLLCPIDPDGPWPRFAEEQWRPITTAFEARLSQLHCLNRPDRMRSANNKLLQHERLTAAGFAIPPIRVASQWPTDSPLAHQAQLVAKNVSEGGWRSPTEFSPARLVRAGDPLDAWPAIWQAPIESDRELRCYVLGDEVVTVELTRPPDQLDVRAANNGLPDARCIDTDARWHDVLVAMTRCLGLDYAVIDALPVGDDLHVLEVNANGVWWFLPDDVGRTIEARLHVWLTGIVDGHARACRA